MDTLLQAVIQGVGQGALDALLALGIVLIYRTTGVLNFAQAATGSLATYVIYSVSQGRALWLALIAGIAVGAATGVATFRTITTIRSRQRALTSGVATLAVAILIQQVVRIGWGTPSGVPFPDPIGLGSVDIGSVSIAYRSLWAIGITAGLSLGIGTALRYTRIGTMLRALADDTDAASLCGGNVQMLIAGIWATAGVFAAIAGFFAALYSFDPTVLDVYFVGALIASVLAGLRSLPAAFAGGIGLEVTYNLFQTYAPGSLAGYTQTFLISLLIVVLVVAPRTWLAQEAVRTI